MTALIRILNREESLSFPEDEMGVWRKFASRFRDKEKKGFFFSFKREKNILERAKYRLESHSSRGNRSQFGSANRLIEERAVGTFNVSDGTQNRVTSSPSPLQ